MHNGKNHTHTQWLSTVRVGLVCPTHTQEIAESTKYRNNAVHETTLDTMGNVTMNEQTDLDYSIKHEERRENMTSFLAWWDHTALYACMSIYDDDDNNEEERKT